MKTPSQHVASQHVASLHVAALPFPSHQGTQAAIAAMLDALHAQGAPAELLTYAHGAHRAGPPRLLHHRAPSLIDDASLRSGPSFAKVLNDVGLALAVRRHARGLVVAHHVEAAAASRAAGCPVLFVAHTALGPELPTYLPSSRAGWSRSVAALGRAIDRASVEGASAVAAISPLLAEELAALTGRVVHTLPIPWTVPPPITAEERARARVALAIEASAKVVLYAGNLDGYQGLEVLVAALAPLDVKLLIATEDPLSRAPSLAARRGVTLRSRLATEADRRRAHAAADLVALPRRAPGGLPVKLLDGMARGLPVATVPRALAGHRGTPAWVASHDDAPPALREAIEAALSVSDAERRARGAEGRAYVARHHAGSTFCAALEAAQRDALTG